MLAGILFLQLEGLSWGRGSGASRPYHIQTRMDATVKHWHGHSVASFDGAVTVALAIPGQECEAVFISGLGPEGTRAGVNNVCR